MGGSVGSVNGASEALYALVSELSAENNVPSSGEVRNLSLSERPDPYQGAFAPSGAEIDAPGDEKARVAALENVREKLVKVSADLQEAADDTAFNIYQVAQCVLTAAQAMKTAHRLVRKAELDNETEAVLSEADKQMSAARTAMGFGIAGGVVSIGGQVAGIATSVKSFDTKQTVLNDCGVNFLEGEDRKVLSALGDVEKSGEQYKDLLAKVPDGEERLRMNKLFSGNVDNNFDYEAQPGIGGVDDPAICSGDFASGGRYDLAAAKNSAQLKMHQAELRHARIEGGDCTGIEAKIAKDQDSFKAFRAKTVHEINLHGLGTSNEVKLAVENQHQMDLNNARSTALCDLRYQKAERDMGIAMSTGYLSMATGQTLGGIGNGLGDMKRADAHREEARSKIADEHKTQAKELMDTCQQIVEKVIQVVDRSLQSVAETNKSIMTRG